jgi:MFS family permease
MKNLRALWLLFAANSVSGASQGILMIAVPWYVTAQLGRPGLFGSLYMGVTVVSLFWGLYAGALVDRYDRRKIFLTCSAVGMLVSGAMAGVGFAGGDGLQALPLWAAGAAFATTIFIFNIHYPNLYAFGQEITEPKDYGRITSYLEVQGQLTNAFAGAMGALLLEGFSVHALRLGAWSLELGWQVDPWPLHHILLLDAGTYALSGLLLLAMRYERVARRPIQKGSVWTRLRTGMAWLKEHPLVLRFGAASYAIFVTVLVTGFYLQAIYVKEHLKADGSVYALSESGFALGSVLAGLLVMRVFATWKPTKAIILLSFVAASFFLIGMVNTWLPLFYLSFLLLGTSNAGTRILRMTWLFGHVPNDLIGRTGSVFNTMNVSCRIAFIGLFALPLFTGPGIIWAFGLQALFILGGAAVLWANYARLTANSDPPAALGTSEGDAVPEPVEASS